MKLDATYPLAFPIRCRYTVLLIRVRFDPMAYESRRTIRKQESFDFPSESKRDGTVGPRPAR